MKAGTSPGRKSPGSGPVVPKHFFGVEVGVGLEDRVRRVYLHAGPSQGNRLRFARFLPKTPTFPAIAPDLAHSPVTLKVRGSLSNFSFGGKILARPCEVARAT